MRRLQPITTELKSQVLKAMLKGDEGPSRVSRRFGISRSTYYRWHRELLEIHPEIAQRRHKLSRQSNTLPKTDHPAYGTKEWWVRQLLDRRISAAKLAKVAHVDRSTLYRWKNEVLSKTQRSHLIREVP